MIYLDYQATTPLAPEARAAMLPFLDGAYGNPHSPHRMGREAAAAVEAARTRVLAALMADAGAAARPDAARSTGERLTISPSPTTAAGMALRQWEPRGAGGAAIAPPFADGRASARSAAASPLESASPEVGARAPASPGRLVFTSGATEALNWAIKGSWARRPAGRRRIVTIATEHAAVLDTCAALAEDGAEVIVLGVDRLGRIDMAEAHAAIDERVVLVAAMLVNNEIGVVSPIAAIGALARAAGAVMLCDAVQGYGRVRVPADACDLIAVSAHKIHGPKGIGALWIRDGREPRPLLHGGGQEQGIRSGTLSPMLCAGFGAAAQVAQARMVEDAAHVSALFGEARSLLGGWEVNGAIEGRWFGNLNIRRDGIDSARLISEVRGVAFSAGSACASGSGRPSHVLRALGLADAAARSSIRLGFGRYTTREDLVTAIGMIDAAAVRQGSFA